MVTKPKNCSAEGCVREALYRDGYCSTHHSRIVRNGDLLIRRGTNNLPYLSNEGYWMVYRKNKREMLHRVIVERVIGKPLPSSAVVHHVNGDKTDNRNSNLVVCPSDEYHALLHKRTVALEEAGNADWLKCKFCKEWGPPTQLSTSPRNSPYHKACVNEYRRERSA